MCADYLCDGEPDFTVRTTPEDIRFEQKKSERGAVAEHRPVVLYPDSYLETLAVYRKIADVMPQRGILLMHGAVLGVSGEDGDEAVLFTAISGVGKTTHVGLWLKYIPHTYVVNGDKPLIRLRDGRAEACGTPWAGKEGYQRNTIVPLKAVVLLERGKENSIEPVTFSEALPELIRQTHRPKELQELMETMQLIHMLGEGTPLYRLRCNMEPEAAKTAYDGIFHLSF